MALQKEIELENGIILNYHRIVSLNKITNHTNIIEVASYTSEEKREQEKEAQNNEKEEATPIDVYIKTDYIEKEYDENEGIEECYEYLKTLDKYKNAENC